jgi:recombination protein RecA
MAEKNSVIEAAMEEINKKYGGDGNKAIFETKDGEISDIETIPTGCISLDYVLACGGLPRGRIMEISGAESSGKSTLALFLVAAAQKSGGKALWLDVECAYSREYAKKVGVDVDKLILAQPTTGEEALDIVGKMVDTNEIDIIVLDSVAALVPAKELEGELIDENMALQARLMGKALRILTGSISKTKTVVIFINQERDKIGIYWGKKTTTPGGKALKFFSSIRLEVRKGENILDANKDVIGNWIKVCAIKNKVGLPFRKAELELYYSRGVDVIGDLLDRAVEKGIIVKSGYTYTLGGEKIGISRDKVKEYLSTMDKKELKKIKDKLLC